MSNALPSDMAGLSKETLAQLQKLGQAVPTSNTIAFFPISTIVYFTILYLSAKLCEQLLYRFSSVYRKDMTPIHRRTSVIYVLNIVYTTAALVLQLVTCPAFAQEYTERGVACLRVASVVVTGLYLFELTYRDSMRPQMLLHHFATIFAVCFVNGVLATTMHPSLIVTGLVWLFQATTEQLSFVALLMYRLKCSPGSVMWLLRVSAVQTFIPKLVFAIYLIIWWGQHQMHNTTTIDIAYSVVLFVSVTVLMFTQVYGCWVLWKVGDSVMARSRKFVIETATDVESGISTPVNEEKNPEKVEVDQESISKMCRTSSISDQAAIQPSLSYYGMRN